MPLTSYQKHRRQKTAATGYVVPSHSHFSLHVLAVQSAYIRAPGSVLARKPTSDGGFSSFDRPSFTSDWRLFAIVLARITLHDADISDSVAISDQEIERF